MKQTEESFLSEEGIINLNEIQYGKLNIIEIIMQTMIQGAGKIKKYAFAV